MLINEIFSSYMSKQHPPLQFTDYYSIVVVMGELTLPWLPRLPLAQRVTWLDTRFNHCCDLHTQMKAAWGCLNLDVLPVDQSCCQCSEGEQNGHDA